MKRQAPLLRAVTETGFIMFLFYSNLLMGEFTRSNSLHGKSIVAAVVDVFTFTNFCIGTFSAVIGHFVVEYIRKKV